MTSPADAHARATEINRRYTIHVRHDLRRHVIRPYSATITHGLFHVGWPTDLTWHARTQDALVAKCDRWARRDAARNGIADPTIEIQDPQIP